VGLLTVPVSATSNALTWLILIFVYAYVNNSQNVVVPAIIFCIIMAYSIFLWTFARLFLYNLAKNSPSELKISQFNVYLVFTVVLFSAWYSDADAG
jgi:uncharacterized membrane protein